MLKVALANYKTTLLGLAAGVINLMIQGVTFKSAVLSVLLAMFGVAAKDGDVTGGSRPNGTLMGILMIGLMLAFAPMSNAQALYGIGGEAFTNSTPHLSAHAVLLIPVNEAQTRYSFTIIGMRGVNDAGKPNTETRTGIAQRFLHTTYFDIYARGNIGAALGTEDDTDLSAATDIDAVFGIRPGLYGSVGYGAKNTGGDWDPALSLTLLFRK